MNSYVKSSTNETISIRIAFKFENDQDRLNFGILFNKSDREFSELQLSTWDDVDPFNLKSKMDNYPDYKRYIYDGQILFTNFLLHQNNKQTPNITLNILPEKTPSMRNLDDFTKIYFTSVLPFLFSIAYISILFKFVLWLVNEKVIFNLIIRRRS